MADPLLQACIEEFGIAAVYAVGERIAVTNSLKQIDAAGATGAWWTTADQAEDVGAAVRGLLRPNRPPAEAIARASQACEARLTPHAAVMRRARHLVDIMNEKFETLKESGELRPINAGYRRAREAGERMPPYKIFLQKFKRNMLVKVVAETFAGAGLPGR